MKTENAPCVVLLSPMLPSAAEDLKGLGLRVLLTEPRPELPGPVCCHADLVCFPLGKGRLLTAPGSGRLDRALRELGFLLERPSLPLDGSYPGDTPLCALRVGERIFCRVASTDPRILANVPGNRLHNVNQGYARCSALPVGENALVTADPSIAGAARNAGVEVLLLRPGGIRLDGYETGFIGGCGGMVGPDSLYLTGRAAAHPEGEKIRSFAAKRGIRLVEGSAPELVDIGSVLLL